MYKSVLLLALFSIMILSNACQKDYSAIDDEAIQEYLEDNNLEAVKDPSGVYIVTLDEGNDNNPSEINYITIHYEGSYLDNEVFDSSLDKDPIATYLFNFIEGWKIGIPYFGEGGKGYLFIPSELAYGSDPPGAIRKNAVLKFYIELIKVE
jgi:FKBP-type peptidyl-prolyl cis-trans isomerase FkpA